MKKATDKSLRTLFIIALLPILYLSILLYTFVFNTTKSTVVKVESPTKIKPVHTTPRVVISLTSFSSRLNYIDATLQSIFHQTFPFDQIYLNVPVRNYTRYNLSTSSPTTLTDMQKKYEQNKLTLSESVDYGPSTKLLGVLRKEQHPETIIITIDDDVIYHSEVVQHLVQALMKLKTNSSVAVVCETVVKKGDKPQWGVTNVYNRFCKHGFLAAYAGAAYRRKYFDDSIFDYQNVPQGCVLHDDVYISGYLYRRGVYPFIIAPIPRTSPFPWSVIKHVLYTNLTVG